MAMEAENKARCKNATSEAITIVSDKKRRKVLQKQITQNPFPKFTDPISSKFYGASKFNIDESK